LRALVAQTQSHKLALVHGDVSPKNILVGTRAGAWPSQAGRYPLGGSERSEPGDKLQPVLLDAECAWWGDPAFDLAFCLNHLLLKCLWLPQARDGFLQCFAALAQAYLDGVSWEARAAIEQRAAALLPGLMLARVDGKSPVEYLTDEAPREAVRRVAAVLLRQPVARLADVSAAWREELMR
jgi:thiamine kinase-like enzyme